MVNYFSESFSFVIKAPSTTSRRNDSADVGGTMPSAFGVFERTVRWIYNYYNVRLSIRLRLRDVRLADLRCRRLYCTYSFQHSSGLVFEILKPNAIPRSRVKPTSRTLQWYRPCRHVIRAYVSYTGRYR